MSLFLFMIITDFFFHTQICYFFYKNIAFGFSIWLYEAYTSFSAQSVYSDWFLSFYNVFFTALPVAALGIFEQDVSAASCLKVSRSLTLQTQLWSLNG